MNLFNHSNNSHIHSNPRSRKFWQLIGHQISVDWGLIVIIFVIIAIALVARGLNIYTGLEARLSREASHVTPASMVTIDTKALAEILNDFDTREALRVELLKGYAGPTDPSI